MAKAFFRWLRGELNGFYLKNFDNSHNLHTQEIKDFLVDFHNQQFEIGKITNKNLYGIGKTAGIYLPRLASSESASSIRMTESHIENGYEFSERGLFRVANEMFEFYHCIDDSVGYFIFINYDDINLETDANNRSSLVGDEDVIGYISAESTDIFEDDFTVKASAVLPYPPFGVDYNNFFGNDFLFLTENYAENLDGTVKNGSVSVIDDAIGIHLTESETVGGYEYSERGIWNVQDRMFLFVHTEQANMEANNFERSSLVGDEIVIGYISESETDIFDEMGNVKPDKILPNPPDPELESYNNFYGDQFLFLSEGDGSASDEIVKIRMTDSEISKDGEEISERGLYKIPVEILDDINLLATPELRSSLVGKEPVIGYISEYEEDVVDEFGNVKPEKISTRKPSSGAYSNFHGNQFLFLSDAITTYKELDPALYIEFYKSMQWIRYNGTSIESLCKVTEFACPEGLVTLDKIEISEDGKAIFVTYNYNNVDVPLKQQRLSIWQYIIEAKFPEVTLVENEIL